MEETSLETIAFESFELLSVFEMRLNGDIHFTSTKSVIIQIMIESDVISGTTMI